MLKKIKWIYIPVIMLILICVPFTSAAAASKLNLYFYGTKKNVTYTGQQVKYYYNGAAINTNKTPGIIINGTAFASFNDVFVKSSIKMKYTYNSSKGILTLKKDGTTLVLTANSKTATVNGKKVTLSDAPVNIKFKDKGVTKFFVPTRFVAETFGYTYVWNSASSSVYITSPLKLNYNGKNVNYTGTKGAVTVDGKSINVSDMPSIILNDTAMLRAWKVFGTGPIGATYKYSKSSGVVTLTKDDKVVKLTIGSKKATVNGVTKTLDAAPLVVKNLNNNTEYVMVPGSFVATSLGYNYKWDSTTKTSVITTKTKEEIEEESEVVEDDPVDDVSDNNNTEEQVDKIVLDLGVTQNLLDSYSSLSNLSNKAEISSDTGITGFIYNISKESSSSDREVYAITSTTGFNKTTATLKDQVLNIHVNNASTNDTTYTLGGTYAENISTVTSYPDGIVTTDISIPLLKANTNYSMNLSSDGYTLYVTLYSNYINSIKAGTSNGKDYIEFKGMKDFNVNLSESGNSITLQFLNTVNGTGDKQTKTGLNGLVSVTATGGSEANAVFVLEKSSDATYSVTQDGTTYRITFASSSPVKEADTGATYSVKFTLPGDVSFDRLSVEDRYYEKKIIIKMPGDQTSYYQANPIKYSNSVIKSVTLKHANNSTYIIILTSKIQGYKLKNLSGTVGVVIDNPKNIYKNIVVLDAGHGGTDPGAVRTLNGKTIYEKDLNFKIMYTLMQQYFDNDSEIKAYWSRYDDTKVDLYERAAFATEVGADIFVSLHMNANTSSSPYGTEIYYYEKNTSKTSAGLTSKKLAQFILDSITEDLGTKKRYISSQNLVVTRETKVPAVLIELGFMSNTSDLKLLTDSSFQEDAALAIYNAISSVFEAYPTGR